MTVTEYLKLKEDLIYAVVTSERHSIILSSLKDFFRDSINSVRRFEQINTIGQLLRVLEIRDLLSEDNVECLKTIALKLPNPREILKKITDYENTHVPLNYGSYYYRTASSQQPVKKEAENVSTITSSPLSSTLSPRKKQRIFETIYEDIGSFWRSLGRNLKIREGFIEKLDLEHNTQQAKVTKLMEHFEQRADPQRWFFVLCDALERSGRKDIVRDLQDIMAMNI